MFAFFSFAQFLFAFSLLQFARATVYVTTPLNGTTCNGGQSCDVAWLDNGDAPLLSTIGPCFVGLFNGQGRLIQQIEPVDVASVHSLTFTPDPAAGPNSDFYYINFTTVNEIGNPPVHYTQYSPFFTLAGMTGSFADPVPSDTSSISVPSTVASSTLTQVTSMVTVTPSSLTTSITSSVTTSTSVSTSTAPPRSSTSSSSQTSSSASPSQSVSAATSNSLYRYTLMGSFGFMLAFLI